MAHYKNRKPKSFKGHCVLCSLRSTNGHRCGRMLTLQEKRAYLKEKEEIPGYDPRKRLPKY